MAQDQMEANSNLDDVQSTAQQFMEENSSVFGRISAEDTIIRTRGIDDCATVTIIRSQKKMVVDFGSTGCLGPHGRLRKGKWLISYTSNWRNEGAVITIGFENFAFTRPGRSEYILVDNSSSQTITTLNAGEGVYEFKREFSMKSTLPTGQSRTHYGTRFIVWNNNLTTNRFDDTFTVSTASVGHGVDRRGRAYDVAVIEPVVTKTACWLQHFFKPVSGVVQINKIGRTKTINYGDGTCGGTISVSVDKEKKCVIDESD